MNNSNIVFVLEFSDDSAAESANKMLKAGWELIHVGTKFITVMDNGQAYYNTAYVVGATQEQYEQYRNDCKINPSL